MAGTRAKAKEPEAELTDLEELARRFDEGGPEALSSDEMDRLEASWGDQQPAVEKPPEQPAEELPEPSPVFGRQDGNPAWAFQPGSAMLDPAAEFDAAQRDDAPLAVHEAVAEVTRRIGIIAKTRRSQGPGENYNFRGIDDVLEALHPILGDVGLLILPGEVIEQQREQRATRAGGTLNVCHLRVRYLLVGPDGTRLTGEAWGEAGDSGDKATQKAHSQSYKTFCLQTFSIPTQQSAADDPDGSSEPARAFTAEEVGRASNAWQAAKQDTTVAALGETRNRALHLLQVPVPMPEEGGPVALGILFDRRRAELERAAQQGPAT